MMPLIATIVLFLLSFGVMMVIEWLERRRKPAPEYIGGNFSYCGECCCPKADFTWYRGTIVVACSEHGASVYDALTGKMKALEPEFAPAGTIFKDNFT